MIVFIVPLKSKQVSKSWALTCRLFERCIRSICNQINADFRVIVVCHDRPDISFSHPSLDYIQVNFEIPKTYEQKESDKGNKVIVGLLYARKFSANHVMVVDADDCISNRISQFTNRHPQSPGWILKKGYLYEENSPLMLYENSSFYRLCGTCNILKCDLCPITNDEEFPEDLAYFYSGRNHKNIGTYFEKKGSALTALPFPGVIYTVGNGENIYQSSFSRLNGSHQGKLLFHIKQTRKFRPILPNTRKEFGLYGITN